MANTARCSTAYRTPASTVNSHRVAAISWMDRVVLDDGTLGNLYYYDSIWVHVGLFQQDANIVWHLAPRDVSIVLVPLHQILP